MLRHVLAMLVSGVLAFVFLSPASAQSDVAKQGSARTEAAVASGLLAPAGAAGIKQAQAAQRGRIWNFVPFGLVGGLAALVVLATGDDDSATTTGSN